MLVGSAARARASGRSLATSARAIQERRGCRVIWPHSCVSRRATLKPPRLRVFGAPEKIRSASCGRGAAQAPGIWRTPASASPARQTVASSRGFSCHAMYGRRLQASAPWQFPRLPCPAWRHFVSLGVDSALRPSVISPVPFIAPFRPTPGRRQGKAAFPWRRSGASCGKTLPR